MLALIIILVLINCLLACVPGWIASARGHREKLAITICGLFGVIFPPAWMAAMVWAFTGPARGHRRRGRRYTASADIRELAEQVERYES